MLIHEAERSFQWFFHLFRIDGAALFARLGRFTFRRRFVVIGFWFLLFLSAIPTIPLLPGALAVGGFSSDDTESARTRQLLQRELPSFTASSLLVIFQHGDLTAFDEEFQRMAQIAIDDLIDMPEVLAVQSFTEFPRQVSADARTAYTSIQLGVEPEDAQHLMPEINARLRDVELTILLAGAPAFYEDIERTSEQDLRRAELIAIPFAMVALLFVFRGLVAAGTPLIAGAMGVAASLGTLYLVAQQVDLTIFVLNLATMLGLGLAIDYSLFMTSRFREELEGSPVDVAVERTVDTAGRAVFFSGFTVMLGLAGLMVFDFMFLRSIGFAGAVVVLFALAAALTLLPAILATLGTRINRFSFLTRGKDTGAFWYRVGGLVMRRPWRIAIPTVAVLLLLGSPFLGIRLSAPDATILPLSTDSRQAFETLRSEFGDGEISPVIIAIEPQSSISDPDVIEEIYRISRTIAADERVWRIDSIVTIDHRLTLEQYQILYRDLDRIPDAFVSAAAGDLVSENVTAMFVYTQDLPASDEARALLDDLRALDDQTSLNLSFTGGSAEITDTVARMYSDFPLAALIVVGSTYLALLIHFRSVILPLKAILINVLSLTASYGALVVIFQEGWFSRWLGFAPMGFIEASLPILMFCVLFGLSMDYEVFLLSRMREEWDRTRNNREAVQIGLARSGRIITGAALIVVVVTASFVSAEVVLIKALGLGIAIAVALDASVVRTLVVPATMRLVGDWNWWLPAWLERLLPDSPFEEAPPSHPNGQARD
jgi:putative drug exporter of the RND superfamily